MQRVVKRGRKFIGELRQQTHYALTVLIDGEAETETKLGVILEQRVSPRRPTAVGIGSVWRGRQVAAVNRGTAGGVGNQHSVAVELSQHLIYGVSPQPEQAPEYSNSGLISCEVRISIRSSLLRSISGRLRK